MASTTLVTFLLNSVHATATVDVLGSWDNFSKPYAMVKDSQKGHGSWYGCHVFTNVICDGDPANCCSPRTGGLMMGGTYWYYYRRNGNHEFHNPDEPSTSSCPLLPGQIVNVLTIPDSHLPKSSTPLPLTMDPAHRLRRPVAAPIRSLCTLDTSPLCTPAEEIIYARFSRSLARLQTGVGDTIISAYLQARPTEELLRPRHPAAHRRIHTAAGPFAKSQRASHLNTIKVGALQLSPMSCTRPASRLNEKTFFDKAVSHPKESAKEFTNPFSMDPSLANVMPNDHPIATESEFRRPSSWPSSSPFERVKDDWTHRQVWQLHHHRPQSGPPTLMRSPRQEVASTATPRRMEETLVIASRSKHVESTSSTQHDQALSVVDGSQQPAIFEQVMTANKIEADNFLPVTTSDAPVHVEAPPPTRSKSQKLKRFASLNGRIKLPPISQMPQIPKMKSWRPNTKHSAEETSETGTVFNEATSTWTPAMTSPSESSPTLMSPFIEPMTNKSSLEPPDMSRLLELPPSSQQSGDDVPPLSNSPESPRRTFSTRGGNFPKIMDSIMSRKVSQSRPARESKASRTTSRYPIRGTSLPTQLTENQYTSSQETITQASHAKSPRAAIEAGALPHRVAGLHGIIQPTSSLGAYSKSSLLVSSQSASSIDAAASEPVRESFDEEVHRDQIRQILLSHSDHADSDGHRNSFIMHQRQRERTFGSSSHESDSDDDYPFRATTQRFEGVPNIGKGVSGTDAFNVADFDHSFDYLADVIF